MFYVLGFKSSKQIIFLEKRPGLNLYTCNNPPMDSPAVRDIK